MAETLFHRVAREARIAAPPLLAPAEDYDRFCRAVYARFPAWGYDSDYLDIVCATQLPRALALLGVGRAIRRTGTTDEVLDMLAADLLAPSMPGYPRRWRDWREVMDVLPSLRDRWHPGSDIIAFAIAPDDARPLLLHTLSLQWDCPALSRRGDGLVELGAWRWGVSPAKAAWRLARRLGLERPYP